MKLGTQLKLFDNTLPGPAGIEWYGEPFVLEWDLPAMLADGRAEVIKDGGHRAVHRVEWNGQKFYWKFCRLFGPRAWLREWVRPPKARMEYDKALHLLKHGLPTFEPIAWGRQRGLLGGQSHLVTRAIEDAEPFSDWLERKQPFRLRRQMATAFGAYMAKLHAAGVEHPDPHPGNFLLKWKDGEPAFYLLDLHAIKLHRGPLDEAARMRNLVLLNRWFIVRGERTDRSRFMKSYGTLDAVLLEQLTRKSNFAFWRSRYARGLWHASHFPATGKGAVQGRRIRVCPKELAEQLAHDPDAPFLEPGNWKDSRSSAVRPLDFDGNRYVWKRTNIRSKQDVLKNYLRRSMTRHSWLMGHALLDRFLPTAKPVLFLERGRGEGYLLTERIEDAKELHAGLDAGWFDDVATKRELICTLARTVKQLHESNITHRDLKAANLMVRMDVDGPRVWFIDVVGMRVVRRLPLTRGLRDVVRLNASFVDTTHFSRTDRLRFLLAYLRWNLRREADWKTCWKGIEAGTRAKMERNRKVGRILK